MEEIPDLKVYFLFIMPESKQFISFVERDLTAWEILQSWWAKILNTDYLMISLHYKMNLNETAGIQRKPECELIAYVLLSLFKWLFRQCLYWSHLDMNNSSMATASVRPFHYAENYLESLTSLCNCNHHTSTLFPLIL